jgi:predicted outer membrane repeat protein
MTIIIYDKNNNKNNSKLDGGAIFSNKTINIEYINNDNKIMFYNNRAGWNKDGIGNGGAIYVGYPGSLTIKNISGGGIDFCNNTCGGDAERSGGGGAIYSNSNMQLIDATIIFRNNNADSIYDGDGGGAIYIVNTELDDDNYNTLTISGDNTNLIFHDNNAEQGGAIYISPHTHLIIQPDISISDFSFLRNTPDAIYFDYSSQIITCPPLNIDCSNLPGEDQCTELSSGIPKHS